MNWPYIAGFFDGEGCLTLQKTRMMITLYQSGDIGKQVLTEIQGWMEQEGVNSTLYRRKKLNLLSKKELWELRITKREYQIKFLRGVLPYSRVKRIIAQDFLRYYTLYPCERWYLFGKGKIGDENRLVWHSV